MITETKSSALRRFVFVLFCTWVGIVAPQKLSGLPPGELVSIGASCDAVKGLQNGPLAANSDDDQGRMAESYVAMARYQRTSGHLDSAVYYCQAARSLFAELDDLSAVAGTLLELKELYSLKGSYLDAMNRVYEALHIYEGLGDERGIARCYANIADLLYYSERLASSVEYANKAIALQRKLGYKADLAASYFTKACPELFIEGRQDSSLASINTALAIYDEIGERDVPYLKAINWRGNVYKYMGRYDDAITDYENNMVAATKANVRHYEMTSYANIGHIYLMEGEYAKALPNNLKAIRIMKETGDTRNLWENYMHVSTAYENLGRLDSALLYHKEYLTAYEAYLQSVTKRLETEAQVKYETRKKNETITTQALELAQQKKVERLYLSVAFLLLIVLALLLWGYYKRRRSNHSLLALNVELDAKNRQNELLMKEVHHRVKNNLEMVKSLLALQSAKLTDPASREAMLASQSRVQSMGIIHQKLYSGDNPDSIEMKDYFQNLAEEILAGNRAEELVEIHCNMDPIRLHVDTAVPIGLIVNELICNALKYAFSDGRHGEIRVALVQRPDGLYLTVSDNGVGFAPESPAQGTGFGSQLIDLLTRQLNGVLCRENGNGTTLKFYFHPRKVN